MTKEEKLQLYYKAKEAYYNGQEIMTDYEFDELEKELGLENKSEVGTRRNPSYTVKHPYIMGSLSKVQIHKDKDGNVDWDKYLQETRKFIKEDTWSIITPKYDGCSFEVYVNNGKIDISSRGDGEYGKDLKDHLIGKIPYKLLELDKEFTLRGEVLIKKTIFEKKYSEQFTNPRSFVSGVLNHEFDKNDKEFMDKLEDLSIVIYDYRVVEFGIWEDYDWTELEHRIEGDTFFDTRSRIDISSLLPGYSMHRFILNKEAFEKIYNSFDNYRKTCCEYALDGFVIKTSQGDRINNTTERRPKDCVAIKFIPMLEETEVINITWNLGKTSELTPIIWVKPVEMDGRMVQKCSGHNYGYLLEKKVSVGSKIIMSLAGDIIPFLYKVTNTDNFDENKLNVPENTYIDGDIHLMQILNETDLARLKFVNSADVLAIPNIGSETSKKIFEYLTKDDDNTKDFFGIEDTKLYYNILQCKAEDIYYGAGGGKNGDKAKKEFEKVRKNITLVDIIKSCNFRFCGPKVAEQCANYLLTGEADFEHLAKEGYEWVLKDYSDEKNDVYNLISSIGKTIEDFKVIHDEYTKTVSTQIPVILTGEPNDYKTKAEFLQCHPEYRNTTSWKEVQIVFTNSMDSNTGKMKKAREKGIEIRLY